MPWKEQDVVNLRTEFVLRVLESGLSMSELCQEYGISRKTGYKWKERFLQDGLKGLHDESRRPSTSPGEVGESVVCEIVRLKQAHLRWGPGKIRVLYDRNHPGEEVPSESTFKRILDKAGLVRHRRRRRQRDVCRLSNRREARRPNEVWTVDFKGWWLTRDGTRCEPLTIRDEYSKFVLCARPLKRASTEYVREEFERIFEQYGLPETIRSDNGAPFACLRAPLGLSRLSAWWVVLGIGLDRIEPGHPEQNGGHERMHRDIADEVEGVISGDLDACCAALEVWRNEFNCERPHEALGMKCPGEVYEKSSRRFMGTPEGIEYPPGHFVRRVMKWGYICVKNRHISLSRALVDWEVGLKHCGAEEYEVWFDNLLLGRVNWKLQAFKTRL